MTFRWRDAGIGQARCKKCDADLKVSTQTGYVYCTNIAKKCKYVKEPHPTRSAINKGKS